MKIKNYGVRQDENGVAILVEKKDVKSFPFIQSNLYISKKRMEDKLIFIMTPDKKHRLDIVDFDIKDIEKIIKNKIFTFIIVNEKGETIDGYDYDVKIIK